VPHSNSEASKLTYNVTIINISSSSSSGGSASSSLVVTVLWLTDR